MIFVIFFGDSSQAFLPGEGGLPVGSTPLFSPLQDFRSLSDKVVAIAGEPIVEGASIMGLGLLSRDEIEAWVTVQRPAPVASRMQIV